MENVIEKNIIRAERNKSYTVINNEALRRRDLSARAKGIFAYLMTLPDDWKLHKTELYTHFTEGRDAINSAFLELEEAGYITKQRHREANGTCTGWDYTIHETTRKADSNQLTEKPTVGFPAATKYESSLNTYSNSNDSSFSNFELKQEEKSEEGAAALTPGDFAKDFEAIEVTGRLRNSRFSLSQSNEAAYKQLTAKHGRDAVKAVCSQYLHDRTKPAGDLDKLFERDFHWFNGILAKLQQPEPEKPKYTTFKLPEISEEEHQAGEEILQEHGGFTGMMLESLGKAKQQEPKQEPEPDRKIETRTEANRAEEITRRLAAAKNTTKEKRLLEIF